MVQSFSPDDPLSLTFAALAHPVRRKMLSLLKEGQSSVKELAKPFSMSAPAITKHLKVLEKAGLIVRSHEAQYRPAEIQMKPLKEVDKWIEEYRQFWTGTFNRLDKYIDELKEN